jgi:hypothetical protein
LPKKKEAPNLESLARLRTVSAVNTLIGLMESPRVPSATRAVAAIALLDRGWGRPKSNDFGSDGAAHIVITIRNLMSEIDNKSKLIEHDPET